MNDLNTLFKSGLRVRTGYLSGGDPLERWKYNMTNLATKHQAEAKAGREALRKSWHEQQPDGSYSVTIRLNHRLLEIDGQNTWYLADLDGVVEFYNVVIAKLKTHELDQDIISTALKIKSMKQEAMTVLKTHFPDSPVLKGAAEASNHPTVAEQSQNVTNQEI